MNALHLRVTLPVLRLNCGPFAIDPFEQLVGARVCDLLGPLMTGPMGQRRTDAGVLVDVYPLALPDGEGATVPLGAWGELGFANARGVLVLTVPLVSGPFIASRLGDALVSPPEPASSLDGLSRVVNLRVKLRSGARAAFPLGRLGEVGVEASC